MPPSFHHPQSCYSLSRPAVHRRVSLPDRRTKQSTIPSSILTRLISFAIWTHYFPVRTAERILHIMFPETKDHKVGMSYASDQDATLFRHMTFGPRDPHQTNAENEDYASYPPSLVIAIQPPWILAPRDLESFANSRKVVVRLRPLLAHFLIPYTVSFFCSGWTEPSIMFQGTPLGKSLNASPALACDELTNSLWLVMGPMRQEEMSMVHYFQLSGVGFWSVFTRCFRSILHAAHSPH